MGVIYEMLQQTGLLVLFAGSVLGLLVGILLLFQPEALMRLNQYSSRWVSVTWLREWLERPHYLEQFFHRHNRLLSGILLAYTAIGLYVILSTRISWAAIQGADSMAPALLAILFLLSLAFAAAIGLILLLSPSMLYNLEHVANHWTSSDKALEWLEVQRPPIDQHVLRHRFPIGLLTTAGSLYVLITLGYFLVTSTLI